MLAPMPAPVPPPASTAPGRRARAARRARGVRRPRPAGGRTTSPGSTGSWSRRRRPTPTTSSTSSTTRGCRWSRGPRGPTTSRATARRRRARGRRRSTTTTRSAASSRRPWSHDRLDGDGTTTVETRLYAQDEDGNVWLVGVDVRRRRRGGPAPTAPRPASRCPPTCGSATGGCPTPCRRCPRRAGASRTCRASMVQVLDEADTSTRSVYEKGVGLVGDRGPRRRLDGRAGVDQG